MTPLEMEILIHYYGHAGDDYREGNFEAPVVRETIDAFRDREKLIRYTTDEEKKAMPCGYSQCYTLTDRGRVYVEALMTVPLPVQVWVMPEKSP